MNNFKKLTFLILIISLIFMVGCASAVDVTDETISSENSVDDMALNECPSESIQETNAINDDSENSEIVAEAFEDEKLSDGEPNIDITLDVWPDSGVYDEEVGSCLDFYVTDAPAEDLDVKITLDGLKFSDEEPKNNGYDPNYQVVYSFNPNTGNLHVMKIRDGTNMRYRFVFDTIATRVGDATVTIEWENKGEKKQISKTIPVTLGEADLELIKRVEPFPPIELKPLVPVYLPNPESGLKDYELLGQIAQDNGNVIKSGMYPEDKKVGDMLVWYVRVVNHGPNAAYDVNLTDNLPDGVIFDSYEVYTGSVSSQDYDWNFSDTITFDEKTGVFHIPKLCSTQHATFTIYAKATTPGIKTNIANVKSETPDPNMTDNEDDASYNVVEDPDNKGNATEIAEDDEPQEVTSPEDEEVEEEETEPASENSSPEDESFSDTTNSKEVAPKSIGSATGNPVLLVLIALLVITEDIFRRKK